MRLGVLVLPEHDWARARDLWAQVEELGFDHAWTYDHLAWRSLRDRPWYGAVPFLAAAATVTTRVRLGTLVASPNFRHPVPFAREILTLDDLSEGRLTLGLGAGGTGWDAVMLGQDPWTPAERAGRFAEFTDALDRLLREPATSFEGRYYRAVEARTHPGCVQRPRVPFAIAATGPRGMAVAARHGKVWATTGPGREERALGASEGARAVGAQIEMMEGLCSATGRDPASIDRLVLTGLQLDPCLDSVGAFEDACGHYAAAGVSDLVVHWPRPEEPFRGELGHFHRVISGVTT
ncbi:MAG TPA: LLM class flavin-dependent oxidoreductase [Acidimicrobiales bacterium]|nr:LLM class flavin-dependent oxidoreductase [Acidimicrobiales bacterium]